MSEVVAPPEWRDQGVYDLPEEVYHDGPEVSKSGLWTLHNKSPYHYKFGETKDANHMKFGSAIHGAVLEPEHFQDRFMRGPEDRRGSKWTSALEMAKAMNQVLVKESEYDEAQKIRDHLHKDATIQMITRGNPMIEQSAYYQDAETGTHLRIRPDLYAPPVNVMADLKSTTDAAPEQWKKRAGEFGYALQEFMYSEGWEIAAKMPVDAFVFIVVEKEPPYAYMIYELPARALMEGKATYYAAVKRYAECVKNNEWPSYGSGIVPLDLPPWAYKLTGSQ